MRIAPRVGSTRDYTGSPPAVKNGTSTLLETPAEGTDWEKLTTLYPSLTGKEQGLPLMTRSQKEWLGPTALEERPSASSTVPTLSATVIEQFGISIPPSVPSTGVKLDANAQRVLRIHYAERILTDLHQIQQHYGKPTAAVYADSLLHTMREMRDLLPFDPYLEVVMALYDALAFQNRWSECSSNQYAGAYSVLKNLVKQESLSDDKVEKAIMSLEELGFDTTPFGTDVDFEIAVDEED